MWIRIAALAILTSTPFASNADPRLYSPDATVESSTATLSGPLVDGGLVLAKACIACRSEAVRLTAQTRLYIGQRQVTVEELNKFLALGGSHNLVISYDRTAHTVTQLIVSANRPARAGSN